MTTQNDPQSPCVKLCQLNDSREFCLGCRRTITEISQWSRMNNEDKQKVLDRLHSLKMLGAQ